MSSGTHLASIALLTLAPGGVRSPLSGSLDARMPVGSTGDPVANINVSTAFSTAPSSAGLDTTATMTGSNLPLPEVKVIDQVLLESQPANAGSSLPTSPLPQSIPEPRGVDLGALGGGSAGSEAVLPGQAPVPHRLPSLNDGCQTSPVPGPVLGSRSEGLQFGLMERCVRVIAGSPRQPRRRGERW